MTQDQLKVLTSDKMIQLILQPLTFHYITDRLYVLTSLFSYIDYIYIYIYIYIVYKEFLQQDLRFR